MLILRHGNTWWNFHDASFIRCQAWCRPWCHRWWCPPAWQLHPDSQQDRYLSFTYFPPPTVRSFTFCLFFISENEDLCICIWMLFSVIIVFIKVLIICTVTCQSYDIHCTTNVKVLYLGINTSLLIIVGNNCFQFCCFKHLRIFVNFHWWWCSLCLQPGVDTTGKICPSSKLSPFILTFNSKSSHPPVFVFPQLLHPERL